jgi:GNAT superfamily N-acetyltransferase
MRNDEITGPEQLTDVPAAFEDDLAGLWLRASDAGGAVGFGIEFDPADVVAAAKRNADLARAGSARFITLRRADELVGVVKLEPGDSVTAHRGMLKLLMVDPSLQSRGWGRKLVDACIALAADLGLEQLYLSARSRTGLEEYYTALGWTEVGRYPGGVRVAPGDDRDEVWFFRSLAPTPARASSGR